MSITDITAEKQGREGLIRLAAYCRVSSNSDDQLHSFASQIRYYSEYTKKHPEYLLVDIYADEGLSGTDMTKRDEQNRMIRDCKKGKIDRIIVKSVSRFARNTEELLVTLRLLKGLNVSVYFEEQGIDTEKLNMEMIVTFPGMAAQQESVAISQNVRWSYQKRMQAGDYNCNSPAYGFSRVNGELVPKEDEARIVRRIFDLYIHGVGIANIAHLLNEQGIQKQNSKKRWCKSTIAYILSNERYMGDVLLQKTFTTETIPFRDKKNRGERPQYYVEHSNPAIVSKDTFLAAKKLMAARKTNDGGLLGKFPLSQIIHCTESEIAFRRKEIGEKTYWLYEEKSRRDPKDIHLRVREDMVYAAFTRMVQKVQDNRKELLGKLLQQIETMQMCTSGAQDAIKTIDKNLADLNAKNLVITRLYTKGTLNAAEYAKQTAELGNQISALRIERRRKLAGDEEDAWVEEIKELDGILSSYVPTGNFDESLFRGIVKRIIVQDNARLTFRLIGGIELTEEIEETGRCKHK